MNYLIIFHTQNKKKKKNPYFCLFNIPSGLIYGIGGSNNRIVYTTIMLFFLMEKHLHAASKPCLIVTIIKKKVDKIKNERAQKHFYNRAFQ
jgi:uncharacterized membrane-anchored protein YitT (DUF2179 family)